MKIIIDVFGGDHAPLEILKGSAAAKDAYSCDLLLCGDENQIRRVAEENAVSLAGMQIVHAPDVIGMEDDPGEIMKGKNQSSMAVAMRLLGDGAGDALVSAGSTGALLIGGTLMVKRIKGIKRCALAPLMPGGEGLFMLIDGGANVECRPEMLQQFGVMGSIYMEKVMKIPSPKVGLANIGTEPGKGGGLQLETYQLLRQSPINFIGNIEARDFPAGLCDVLVADGFTGNVILKLTEGVASTLLSSVKGVFTANLKGKIAASLVIKEMRELKRRMSTEEYGGAPLLGMAKPMFKAHGNSNAFAFQNAIRCACDFVKADVITTITQSLQQGKEK